MSDRISVFFFKPTVDYSNHWEAAHIETIFCLCRKSKKIFVPLNMGFSNLIGS